MGLDLKTPGGGTGVTKHVMDFATGWFAIMLGAAGGIATLVAAIFQLREDAHDWSKLILICTCLSSLAVVSSILLGIGGQRAERKVDELSEKLDAARDELQEMATHFIDEDEIIKTMGAMVTTSGDKISIDSAPAFVTEHFVGKTLKARTLAVPMSSTDLYSYVVLQLDILEYPKQIPLYPAFERRSRTPAFVAILILPKEYWDSPNPKPETFIFKTVTSHYEVKKMLLSNLVSDVNLLERYQLDVERVAKLSQKPD